MSTFTPTVESIGDAAIINGILDRSITELHDNIVTSVGNDAFAGCASLDSVLFSAATKVGNSALKDCLALRKADFYNTIISLGNYAFYRCKNLEALILRGAEMSRGNTNAFDNSAIAEGTGYIYVPAALVDAYSADSVWSKFASQIRAIEDYPVVCTPYTWEAVFISIANGTYASVYKIGDTVPLDLGSEGVVNMEIVAIDADDKADGSGKAPITWISKELLATSHRMNPTVVINADGTYQEGTGGIGGWEKSEMRTYLQDTIKPLIPETVRSSIVPVTKYTKNIDSAGNIVNDVTSTEDVWLPSVREIGGGYSYGDKNEHKGVTYSTAFPTKTSRIKGTPMDWWTRTASEYYGFYYYDTGGDFYNTEVKYSKGVALGFCT